MTQIEINNNIYFFTENLYSNESTFMGPDRKVTRFYKKIDYTRRKFYLFGERVNDFTYDFLFSTEFWITEHSAEEEYLKIIKQVENNFAQKDVLLKGKFKIN